MHAPVVLSFSGSASVDGRRLSGVAHAFGEVAALSGSYEVLAPTAFDQALSSSDVRAFVEHDRRLILGRQSAGTLRVWAAADGLHYEIPEVPNTSYGNDLLESVRRGDVTENSFSFMPGQMEHGRAKDGLPIHTHTSVAELIDVSPVTMPAFGGTTVQLRAIQVEAESIPSQLARARARAANRSNR